MMMLVTVACSDREKMWAEPVLENLGIGLQSVKKAAKNVNRGSRCCSRDSNQVFFGHEPQDL